MYYYINWSPKTGEATYTCCFLSREEREEYKRRIDYKSIQEWEK